MSNYNDNLVKYDNIRSEYNVMISNYNTKMSEYNTHQSSLEKRTLQKKREPTILENSRFGFIASVHEN